MIVNIRFLCIDIYSEGKNDFNFELEENSTLETLIEKAHALPHVSIALSDLKKSVFMINSVKSPLSAKLKEGDKVIVLRPLGGG